MIVEKPIAITVTKDYSRPYIWKVKSCYFLTHPDIVETFWNTKILHRFNSNEIAVRGVIDSIESTYETLFLPNVNRGDVVSPLQIELIDKYNKTKNKTQIIG